MALLMEKRVAKVKLVMQKRGAPAELKAEIEFELDVSGSTKKLYLPKNGQPSVMQETAERLMAVALRLDADGKMGVTSFSDTAHRHDPVSADTIDGYIDRTFIPECKEAGNWEQGTNYARALTASLGLDPAQQIAAPVQEKKGFFAGLFGGGNKANAVPTSSNPSGAASPDSQYPTVHMFLSDGEDFGDSGKFHSLVSQHADHYFMLIGVGPITNFGLMKRVAQLPNCGFVHLDNLDLTDDDLYELILAQELCDWLKARQPVTA